MAQNKEITPFPGVLPPGRQKPAEREFAALAAGWFAEGTARGDERAHQAPHKPTRISNEGELSP
jgi:hypothetical protein